MGIPFPTFKHDCDQAHWLATSLFFLLLCSVFLILLKYIWCVCLKVFIRRYPTYIWNETHSHSMLATSPCLYCMGSEKGFTSKLWKKFHQLHGSKYKITYIRDGDQWHSKKWFQKIPTLLGKWAHFNQNVSFCVTKCLITDWEIWNKS